MFEHSQDVGTQDPDPVGQQLLGQLQRARGITTLAGPEGDVVTGDQDVGWSGGCRRRLQVSSSVAC